MRLPQSKVLMGAAFLLLANAALSYGDPVIVSNLTSTPNGTGTIYASGPPQWYAQEFLTGSSNFVLSSIIASLGDASGSFTAGAELLNNSSGLPESTVLTTFKVPTIPTGSPVNETFTPNTNVTLLANTDYWFVLTATGTTGSYQWQYTNTLNAALPNYAYSNDSGATYSIGTPPGPFLIGVVATPEPGSLILSAIGLFACGMVVRARRPKTSE